MNTNRSSKTILKPGEPNHCRFCGSPYTEVDNMAEEIERLRAELDQIKNADTSHLPYEKGWQDGRADAWRAYSAGSPVEVKP